MEIKTLTERYLVNSREKNASVWKIYKLHTPIVKSCFFPRERDLHYNTRII